MAGERLALFPTCVVETLSPEIGDAATRVLEHLGYDVVVPPGVGCCGQPAWNSGFAADAARVARPTLDALDGEQRVCVPAGSCATMMRVYWPELFRLAGDPGASERAAALAERVFEFSELVARSGPIPGSHPARVAYHRSCHMLHELEIDRQPLALLDALEGCERVSWDDDRCCGFGGTFAVKLPEISVAMADAKIASLTAADPDELVGCDRSCLLHLEARMRRLGIGLPVRHLAEVLAAALDSGEGR
jgi:L-lactate dehydrogenase complex protein LldE